MAFGRDQDTDKQTLRIFWQAGLRHKRLFWLSWLFPLNVILMNVIAPLFIGKTLGALATPSVNPVPFMVTFIVAGVAGLICNRFGHVAMVHHQAHGMRDMHKLALSTLLRRSVGFHNDNMSGKLVSDASDYPNAYAQIHNAAIGQLTPFLVTLIAGSAIIYFESWVLGLFITLMTVITIGTGLYDSRKMMPLRLKRLVAGKAVTAHLADAITNVQTVKTFANEKEELRSHKKLGDHLLDVRLDNWFQMSTRGNRRMVLLVILQILFVLTTIWLVRRDPSLLGVGIFAFSFTIMLSIRLFEVNIMFRTIEESLLQASPMTKIILENPEIVDHPNAKALRITGGAVEFKNVTFHYHDTTQEDAVFAKLNLTISPGEKVGLVGPSGGGKSTLTRLLLRFDNIAEGEILIDGQNIARVTQSSLRQSIAYVPQEPLLFHRTIEKNIAYGKPAAKLTDIKKAAAMAHADNFIDGFKNGYKTIVGERGVKLSGGQRQRIAIARAILKDAPILILDEATSALDSESEKLIQDALWKLMENRTAVVIAHRLSTIQKMDRIVVLEKGRIVEEGTHKELLKRKGLYAKLWAHQSGGFLE